MLVCPGNRTMKAMSILLNIWHQSSTSSGNEMSNQAASTQTGDNTRKSRLSSMYTGTSNSLPQETERENHPTFSYQHIRWPAQKQSRSLLHCMSFVVDMHKRTHSKLQSTPSDASSTSILASFFPSASSRNIYPPKRFPTLSLQDLANDLRCFLVSTEELLTLLALALDRVILVQ